MNALIGRSKELSILKKACDSNKSNLITIYGRRRIGKTYLVNYMFAAQKDKCIFFRFTGSHEQSNDVQLVNFINSISDWFGTKPSEEISKWPKAFKFLQDSIKEKQTSGQKAVVFFDEIPWVDPNGEHGFLSALGHFWNDFAEPNTNIIGILCGSNSAWLKNKIFEDTDGPLYQRLDIKIPLRPFTLKETKDYLINEKNFHIDDKTVIDYYMIFGGVAKYLSFLDSSMSLSENVDALMFNIDGHLNKEYSKIFTSLFGAQANYYSKILDTLSENQAGLLKIQISENIKDTNNIKLSKALDTLVETGFIMSLNRFGSKKINEKYFLCDLYVFFHNKWVRPLSKNEVISLQKPYFSSIYSSQQFAIWSGFAFEKVCLTNIDAYLRARSTKGLAKSYGYWAKKGSGENDDGAQIDILIMYQNDIYDIVECKYYNAKFEITKKYKENIADKIEQFKKYLGQQKFDIKLVFLTTYGCVHNMYYNGLNIAADLTIDDLLKT